MRYLLLLVALCTFHISFGQDSPPAGGKDSVHFSQLDFESFKKLARFENKPYFIMFSASWCAPCHRIRNELFTDSRITSVTNSRYLAYYIDIEDFTGAEINSKYFKIAQLPVVIFFDPSGRETDRAIGYFDAYYFFRKLRAHIPPSQWGPEWQAAAGEN